MSPRVMKRRRLLRRLATLEKRALRVCDEALDDLRRAERAIARLGLAK